MVTGTLKYKNTTCSVSIPATWDELNKKQLLYIAKRWELWREMTKNGQRIISERSMLLLNLCGITSWLGKRKFCKIMSYVDERSDVNMLDCTDFVFNKLNLTKNHIPKIRIGLFTWFYGPGDRLNNISIEEFSFAFSCYINYSRTSNETHLNDLVAILYRPEDANYKTTGKRIVPFTFELANLNSKKVSKIPTEYKQAVYLFFRSCVESFEKKYPFIFKRAEKNETGNSSSFFDTVVNMSGGRFGPFDSTKQTNVHIMLKEVNKKP